VKRFDRCIVHSIVILYYNRIVYINTKFLIDFIFHLNLSLKLLSFIFI